MNRITEQFKHKPAFVGYLTVGDGGLQRTYDSALALVAGGVDILEVGVPFSDPVADGPTIQQASQRALDNGTTLKDVLDLIKKLRKQVNIPIILFSYYNPLIQAGNEFYRRAKEASVDGCLVVDLPLEEADNHEAACTEVGIDPIFLISPSTPKERIEKINQHAKGMLYYVSRKGTTGMKSTLPGDFQQKIQNIKSLTHLPVVAGFGISNRDMAADVLQQADGFVIGSLFVKAVADGMSPSDLTQLAKSIDPRKG
ncbi:tryptophan synthase subunit alpha [Candidiatus Paracoxiella cheracis]|uniref:tryptophan synthase subunit alpha n=1 Tax=Candidiatus Paracoxiella cheracis TaxID=3405120 RepID=UPI003BF537C2